MNYRLWTNDERTVLVRMWDDGTVETATRKHSSLTWGPPIRLTEEKTEPHHPLPDATSILEAYLADANKKARREALPDKDFDAADATWTPVSDVTLLPMPAEEDEE